MRKSTKLKIFRRKKRSVILSVLKRHSLRQHTACIILLYEKIEYSQGLGSAVADNNLMPACQSNAEAAKL